MIEIRRTRGTKPESKRKTPLETEKKIVNDYFNFKLTIPELSKKYNKTDKQISGLIQHWEPKQKSKKPKEIPTDKLLLIDSRDYEFALFLLAEYGTRYREPENYKFEEEFNSSIGAE